MGEPSVGSKGIEHQQIMKNSHVIQGDMHNLIMKVNFLILIKLLI
ncbi:hypothetical protein NARC_30244 [Candidatus Nitrosocosmicus arcticus]|uniref:Uncharacterized protein n=1 Tax=Candidatus Nitrosocosmicus arcticus TaxID=2035267 RepID=A0A557SY49_9ARCH|nr:hypothetical protein NARC_30244 [Candidatus Nitrosocosmicus arcticus]